MSLNVRYTLKLLGLLIILLSLSMGFPLVWAITAENNGNGGVLSSSAFSWAIASGVILGLLFLACGYKAKKFFGNREALLLVSLSWGVGAGVAALPYFLWAIFSGSSPFLSFENSYFEAMSSLTTTGATILTNIEVIPESLLLWRAFTHWIGGLGIVVIFIALFPSFGVRSKKMFSFESSGISTDGSGANIKDTSRNLLMIYLGLSFSQIVIMKIVDPSLSWFVILNHGLATIATGGFSSFNSSTGVLLPSVQWVLIAFMAIGGVNFRLYQNLLTGHFRSVFTNSELRTYILILSIGSFIVFISISSQPYDLTTGEPAVFSFHQRIRDAIFHVVSMQTTTGFTSADFDQWGGVAKAVLVFLMFVGGCGGSTAGGIKVIRILSATKVILHELEKSFRPNVVRSIKIGDQSLSEQQRTSVVAYVLGILVLTALGAGGLLVFEVQITGTTAITAAIACINNIGPGLDAVGATMNYGWFSGPSKMLLCLLMAMGRLEVFAIMVIFMPRFWHQH